MTETRLVYLDTETTALSPLAGDVIEAAWAVDDQRVQQMLFPHTLHGSDPEALRINQYEERDLGRFCTDNSHESQVYGVDRTKLTAFRRDLTGATIVAENYGFDLDFLTRKLGFQPWHYRKIELSSVAMTVFDLPRPESMHNTATRLRELGYWIPEADHTAARDVECLRACYITLRGGDVARAAAGDQSVRDRITDDFNDNVLDQYRKHRPTRRVAQS